MKLNLLTKDNISITFESNADDTDFFLLKQIHSNKIINYSTSLKSKEVEADGIFINTDEFDKVSVAIQTADCLPIILSDGINYALVHAGWRGLHQKIIKNSFQFAKFTHAIIAPAICSNCFEVTKEFQEHFPDSSNFSSTAKLCFNLKKEAENQLTEASPSIEISTINVCTKCHPELHSYRQNQTTKRNYTILRKISSQKN